MKKHKLFITNISKEEAWINSFIDQGYRIETIHNCIGSYSFIKDDNPSFKKTIRIDFRMFEFDSQLNDYLALFEDSGWKHIKGNKSSGSQYFERAREDADEEIFSDGLSMLERTKRISDYCLHLFIIYFPLLIVFQTTGIFDFNKMLHPKTLYYTPGLWKMTGLKFWRAFLFETPFAIGRGFIGAIFLIIILFYLYFGVKTLYYYNKEKRKNKLI